MKAFLVLVSLLFWGVVVLVNEPEAIKDTILVTFGVTGLIVVAGGLLVFFFKSMKGD